MPRLTILNLGSEPERSGGVWGRAVAAWVVVMSKEPPGVAGEYLSRAAALRRPRATDAIS